MKSKILIILTLVLTVGIIAALYFLYDLSNQNNQLNNKIQQLTQQITETTDQLAQTEDEVDHLSTAFEELQSSYDDIYPLIFLGSWASIDPGDKIN